MLGKIVKDRDAAPPRRMHRYRRHSYVAILIAAAIITPTSDVFTLLVVSLPMVALYEISILITGKTNKAVKKLCRQKKYTYLSENFLHD